MEMKYQDFITTFFRRYKSGGERVVFMNRHPGKKTESISINTTERPAKKESKRYKAKSNKSSSNIKTFGGFFIKYKGFII